MKADSWSIHFPTTGDHPALWASAAVAALVVPPCGSNTKKADSSCLTVLPGCLLVVGCFESPLRGGLYSSEVYSGDHLQDGRHQFIACRDVSWWWASLSLPVRGGLDSLEGDSGDHLQDGRHQFIAGVSAGALVWLHLWSKQSVRQAGFSSPTPIQAQSWPIALSGRDVVAIAKTGSGKTLGYLIPGFVHIKNLRNNSRMGPTVLVLSPTRELATQIQDEAVKFGRSSRISCACLYGGAPKGPQLKEIDRGVDVVVATPGRLNDVLEMRRLSLRQVSYLVLDEADRMLDMGFEPQIRKIVKELPSRRQTLMFTATWPKEVRKVAVDLLHNPIQVNIGNIDELVANKSITQYVEVIMPVEKQKRLEKILQSQEPGSKMIVFCSTKRMCDQLARILTRQFGAAAIHGDKSQSERDWVLNQFRTGKSPILVATDVAARGLDIKDIRVVINYDFPTGVEDYVHRIGRTGRAGASGLSYTFFCDQDSKYASDLVKILEGAGQHVPPKLKDMMARGGHGGRFRRWGSSSCSRDGSHSLGGRTSDSNQRRMGGLAQGLSSFRSERERGRSDHRQSPHDRYTHTHDEDIYGDGQGWHDSKRTRTSATNHEAVGRGHHSRSRSRSRSPYRRRYGRHSSRSASPSRDNAIDRHGAAKPLPHGMVRTNEAFQSNYAAASSPQPASNERLQLQQTLPCDNKTGSTDWLHNSVHPWEQSIGPDPRQPMPLPLCDGRAERELASVPAVKSCPVEWKEGGEGVIEAGAMEVRDPSEPSFP